jgi:hypothetical protein
MSLEVWVIPFLLCFPSASNPRPSLSASVLTSHTFVDAELREEAHRLGEQLRGLQEEVDRLWTHLDARGAELRELRVQPWVLVMPYSPGLDQRHSPNFIRKHNEHLDLTLGTPALQRSAET